MPKLGFILEHKLRINTFNFFSAGVSIAVPIQMGYNITSPGVGARQCRAPTRVPHVNENRYKHKIILQYEKKKGDRQAIGNRVIEQYDSVKPKN